jgi:hypothetical protein
MTTTSSKPTSKPFLCENFGFLSSRSILRKVVSTTYERFLKFFPLLSHLTEWAGKFFPRITKHFIEGGN